jgi:hypothetical protein
MTTYTSATLGGPLAAGGTMLQAYDTLWDALWHQPYVPAPTLELCRLRLAQLHGADAECALESPQGDLPQQKRDALLRGDLSAFDAAELATIEFTEIYGQDPSAIDDTIADRIKQHYGDKGLVTLIEALGFIDGRIRLGLLLTQMNAAR